MRRVTDSEIEEMRARGFDRITIQEACETRDRGLIAEQLIARIDEAFEGVVLGDGVGLQEAQGLDDFEDEATLAAYRSGDEKDDWRKVPADALNGCNSSLSFFDAEGMKFHLPAFITAELRGEYRFGMAFCLTRLDEHGRSKFTGLDSEQRQIVREFLLLLKDDPDYQFDVPEIDAALTQYWTEALEIR